MKTCAHEGDEDGGCDHRKTVIAVDGEIGNNQEHIRHLKSLY
jgi:hypothetical protein